MFKVGRTCCLVDSFFRVIIQYCFMRNLRIYNNSLFIYCNFLKSINMIIFYNCLMNLFLEICAFKVVYNLFFILLDDLDYYFLIFNV